MRQNRQIAVLKTHFLHSFLMVFWPFLLVLQKSNEFQKHAMHYNSVTYTYFCNLQFCNLQFTPIHTYKKHPPQNLMKRVLFSIVRCQGCSAQNAGKGNTLAAMLQKAGGQSEHAYRAFPCSAEADSSACISSCSALPKNEKFTLP